MPQKGAKGVVGKMEAGGETVRIDLRGTEGEHHYYFRQRSGVDMRRVADLRSHLMARHGGDACTYSLYYPHRFGDRASPTRGLPTRGLDNRELPGAGIWP